LHNQIIFTDEEQTTLSNLSKNHKFSYKSLEPIYPKNMAEMMDYFCKTMRFFTDMYNQVLIDESKQELKGKIEKLLFDYNFLYVESLKLVEKQKKTVEYGKHRIEEKLEDLYISNKEKIHELIDVMYRTGMVVKQFNPSESQGYY